MAVCPAHPPDMSLISPASDQVRESFLFQRRTMAVGNLFGAREYLDKCVRQHEIANPKGRRQGLGHRSKIYHPPACGSKKWRNRLDVIAVLAVVVILKNMGLFDFRPIKERLRTEMRERTAKLNKSYHLVAIWKTSRVPSQGR